MYPEPQVAPVDSDGRPLDRGCTRCAWSAGLGKACLPADGAPGGLLVVGDSPVKDAARPFANRTGSYVRTLISRSWKGPVVYDYAIKCPAPGRAKTKDAQKPIKECRPHLAEVLAMCRPERVLAVGPWAVIALLGRSLDMDSVHRGYGWVLGDVPVFIAGPAQRALENKFVAPIYEADIAWALTTPRPRPSHRSGIVHVVECEADALFAEEALEDHAEVVFDVETAGICHGDDFTVLCGGVTPVDPLEGDAWVWSADALADRGALAVLRRMLETKTVSGSNIKYDAIAAAQSLAIDIKHFGIDTQLVRKLAEPTVHGRLEYASELVGMGGSKEEAKEGLDRGLRHARAKKEKPTEKPHSHWCSRAIRAGTPGGSPMSYAYGLLPDDVLWRYNGRDVLASSTVAIHMRERTARTAPRELAIYESLLVPALPSFRRIEMAGFQADRQAFEAFSAYLNVGLSELKEKFKAYGPNFNPNAAGQVAKILFEDLGLPKGEVSEKTGAPSTDAATLERMRGMHPFVDDILEWRKLEKMDGTYGRGMIEHILSDGRIHPTFRLDGTETMRISSENPNGQNIPRAETYEGKMARDGFTATPGNVIVELDQSQIELRVAAGMSGDEDMKDIFRSKQDYHLRTAQLISRIAWNLAEDAVSDWHRSYCKTVNFGLLYGKTDAGLAQQLGCSIDEAAAIRKAILGKFKKLAELIRHLIYHVRRFGNIEIPWFDDAVHVRPLLEVGSHDKWKRQNAENAAVNSPIQGRAAMYTIAAIPKIHAWIDEVGADAKIVNTVHDSILLDVGPAWVDTVIENSKRIMTSFDCWGVPLVADAKAGLRWGSLRKMKDGELYADAQVRWAAEALKESQL